MPKQRGVFKINGTIDDTTFYEKEGVFYVRRAVKGPTKQQMLTSPRYARTRENMSEFNALSVTAKSITSALNKASEFKDGKLRYRLMSAARNVINSAPGIRGRRGVNIVSGRDSFVKLDLNIKEPLESLFGGELVATHDAARNTASIVVTGINVNEVLKHAPPGATHVRFVQLLGIVSNTVFNEKLNKHVPADAVLNGKHVLTYSDYLSITGTDPVNVQLQTSLPQGTVLNENVGVIQCFGLLFDALNNGAYYRQKEGKAMAIVEVF